MLASDRISGKFRFDEAQGVIKALHAPLYSPTTKGGSHNREGRKRDVTEVVVTTLRLLGPPKNGNGANTVDSSKTAKPSDEGDNPFNELGSEATDPEIPF